MGHFKLYEIESKNTLWLTKWQMVRKKSQGRQISGLGYGQMYHLTIGDVGDTVFMGMYKIINSILST